MKKIITLLATVSAVAFLAACSEQEDKPMPMPTPSSSSSEAAQTSTVTQAAVGQEAPAFT
ncbi:MAG: TlpA family protein disulfide reductase, partial [Streptococcus sanguinis]|nr:TlpA family protein disulfide reductase [Streptococcus sanguinis]